MTSTHRRDRLRKYTADPVHHDMEAPTPGEGNEDPSDKYLEA